MRNHIAAALFLMPGLASAGETDLDSRIDRVTVYPDGAVVTRLGKASLLQGASQIVLRGLPATIDPASIRVEGKGFADKAAPSRSVPSMSASRRARRSPCSTGPSRTG